MRDAQQQLVDLQKVVIKGMRHIRRRRLIKYAHPIVLEGWEGIIIRDLLELIASGDKNVSKMTKGGSVFYEKSPVFCSFEFPGPGGSLSSGQNNVSDGLV